MSYDKQCSSCGGFCGRGGCKRENVKLPTRKPLTDREVFNLAADYYEGYGFKAAEFARAIERAHGIGEA